MPNFKVLTPIIYIYSFLSRKNDTYVMTTYYGDAHLPKNYLGGFLLFEAALLRTFYLKSIKLIIDGWIKTSKPTAA